MSRSITVFPKLNSRLYKAISFSQTDSFTTEIDFHEIELKSKNAVDTAGEVIMVNNEDEPWSLRNSGLTVKRKIRIGNVSPLFGGSGIAPVSSEIGIALRWSSPESRQRGVYEIASMNSDSLSIDVEYTSGFEKDSLKGSLVLETILYIKKTGVPDENESFLGNKKGLVVGELSFLNIRLDGKGSEFPIFEEDNSSSSDPLWSVHMDWDDPSQSPFLDSFQVYLNRNNPNFKYVKKTEGCDYDPYLVNEIISSALTLLVLKLKEDAGNWDEMDRNVGLDDGSVSQTVFYFKHSLGMDFENPVSIHESFRKYFDKVDRR